MKYIVKNWNIICHTGSVYITKAAYFNRALLPIELSTRVSFFLNDLSLFYQFHVPYIFYFHADAWLITILSPSKRKLEQTSWSYES